MSGITVDFLDSTLSSIAIKSEAGVELDIDASGFLTSKIDGEVAINDGGNSITVDGEVSISGSVVVTATDLDIRNLLSSQDSVEIKTAAGVALDIDASGFITSNINGDVNVTATDLDIRDLTQTDEITAYQGGSWIVESVQGGYSAWKTSAASIDNTVGGTELVAAPLAGRVSILIQNLGSVDVYLKEITGVTASTGVKLPKGSSYVADLDESANIFAITSAGTADLRIVEYKV